MDTGIAASVYNNITVPGLPIEWVGIILIIALPIAAFSGHYMGTLHRKTMEGIGQEVDTFAGETTLAAISALLGLLLAFSFGNSLSLSSERKAAMVEESSALGTVFLRVDYAPEPARTELQTAIYEYTLTRILPGDGKINSAEKAQAFLDRTLEAQAKLWPLTLEATKDPVPPPVKTFIAGGMNDALDAHLLRVKSMSSSVSDAVQMMMLAAAITALFLLGNRAGMNGRKLSWRTFVFSGFLIVVMFMIVDTQRGHEGLIRIDDTAIHATIADMETALAGRSG